VPGAREDLRSLPKVELHVHLEGSFTPGRIEALAGAAGESLPEPGGSLFDVSDLASFLNRLDWWCGLVRSEAEAEAQAYGFASWLAAEGVTYAEVTMNPTHWSGLPRRILLQAVDAGFSRAASEGRADCRIVVSLLRRQSSEEALSLVRELEREMPERVVGLGVDGDEASAGPTGPRFAPAFEAAASLGLGLTAHAGESSGPEGVWSALDDLGVSRIDHGVRAAEDPTLVTRLARSGTTLNVCLTSNVRLLYGDLARHPLPGLVASGVPVTINTDDPLLLGTTMSRELELAASLCGWGSTDVRAAVGRAVEAAFCSAPEKELLRRRLAPAG
jgi:adenosine deaminase